MEDSLRYKATIKQLKKEIAIMQSVIDISYLVSSTLDPKEALFLIVKKISDMIPVTRCSIIRVGDEKIFAHVAATFEQTGHSSIKIDLKKYPEIQKAIAMEKEVIINDVGSDPVMAPVKELVSPLAIRSIMVIPIIFHSELIGTLFLRTSRKKRSFSEHDIKLCRAIANASANSLYNAFAFKKVEVEKNRLEKVALTDYMTGIYNIRYFYYRLGEEFSRSQRYNLDISCLMLDIDHFKRVNDRYGHKVGDSVLREFAQLLKRHMRKSDVLARYGGEEFIMLLPQTTEDGALSKAENLRAVVEKHRFRAFKDGQGPSVSIGVASYPNPKIKSREDIITCADNALYTAKTSGRNRVAVYK